ncbi:hypothetical protein [Polyangium sp. 15x6]|uniref:hypothetical protein n=1 Tax=Polyangium sp. 15x6 TaxID=3042687 RepID=UPI00249AB5EB|nr:hypothetical protein [Polyangium sp. 15x6]MDI3285334.1 hypothetical protein [Polyangium sp. 15x6]
MSAERAARVTSPVQHMSSTARDIAAPAALAVGGVVLGASACLTGGLSLAVVSVAFGAAGVTTSIGELTDKYALPADSSEKIAKGVEHVLLEEAKYQAANVSAATQTDQHRESPTTGSETVFIENARASRRFDAVKCEGQIIDGAAHIFYGGVPGQESDPADGPAPPWRDFIEKGITWGGLFTGGIGWWKGGKGVIEGILLGADAIKETGVVPAGPATDTGYFAKDAFSLGSDLYGLKP